LKNTPPPPKRWEISAGVICVGEIASGKSKKIEKCGRKRKKEDREEKIEVKTVNYVPKAQKRQTWYIRSKYYRVGGEGGSGLDYSGGGGYGIQTDL
jgi:hypothetical protein